MAWLDAVISSSESSSDLVRGPIPPHRHYAESRRPFRECLPASFVERWTLGTSPRMHSVEVLTRHTDAFLFQARARPRHSRHTTRPRDRVAPTPHPSPSTHAYPQRSRRTARRAAPPYARRAWADASAPQASRQLDRGADGLIRAPARLAPRDRPPCRALSDADRPVPRPCPGRRRTARRHRPSASSPHAWCASCVHASTMASSAARFS